MSKELLQQALDALIRAKFELRGVTATQDLDEAIAALRSALDAPEPEPVGTVYTMKELGLGGGLHCQVSLRKPLPTGTKLYAAPAVPLTDEQDVGLPAPYMLAKLQLVMPLFQEARDALTAITEVQRKMRGISPTLAVRMDAAGTFSLDDWQAAHNIGGSNG